jgi:NAD(P)-dependent dehydrogenase (short-subunit alcohol dehydrogenase family)
VAFFARRGMQVHGSCRTGADLEKMQAFVQGEGLRGVTLHQADLASDDAVGRLVAAADGAGDGSLDAVFNAAGGFRWVATADATVADFDFLVSANIRSNWLLARHAVPRFSRRGFGRLTFVSARGTLGNGEANLGVYTATKAAVNALVLGLAAELKGTGVTANAVLPTVLDTPGNRQAMPKSDPSTWVTPKALLAVVDDIFASPVLNGALIAVAGGL